MRKPNDAKNLQPSIPIEMFEFWKQMRKTGDTAFLKEKTGKSQPVITDAIKYGHVKNQTVIDQINEFYQERLQKQVETVKGFSKKLTKI